jgi:hypothetical protein
LADTRSLSKKKNAVDAIKAIVINQNEIPTKSSGLSKALDAAVACVESVVARSPRPKPIALLGLKNLNIMRVSPRIA